MPKKGRKYVVLGGIKVSSQQLSEWGKSGGRPKQYSSNAERQRAYKLRKKQEKFGEKAELRNWRSYGEKPTFTFTRMICNNCQSKSIGGSQHLDQQCSHCYQGKTVEDKIKIKKRAGNVKERLRRFRQKKPPSGGLLK